MKEECIRVFCDGEWFGDFDTLGLALAIADCLSGDHRFDMYPVRKNSEMEVFD